MTPLEDLLERLLLLPQVTVQFGGAHGCVPPSLIRYKVIGLVQELIDAERTSAQPIRSDS